MSKKMLNIHCFSGDDPAQDNYQYFLNASGSVIERYKKYNGTQGNSPVDVSDTNRGSTTIPDVEDINRDNTMNTVEGYFKFEIDVKPDTKVGDPYVVSVIKTTVPNSLPNGTNPEVKWIQYKIPIEDGVAVGGISDLRSIRFMRMLMHGFNDQVTLRFGALDLVRGEFRRYASSMENVIDTNPADDETGFDVQSVNIEENSQRDPVIYTLPPGVQREQLNNNNTIVNQNEQSLSLRVYGNPDENKGLEGGDSRAVFKNINIDMRQYKSLKCLCMPKLCLMT